VWAILVSRREAGQPTNSHAVVLFCHSVIAGLLRDFGLLPLIQAFLANPAHFDIPKRHSMRRKIPTTAALVAFESAARHESFTKAADELSLTQSAICRQIATLEEFLGVELFRRSRRGVKLTEAGLNYSRRVAQRLDAVERDTLAVMGQQGGGTLELAVVPTFATQWLLPRLKDFKRLHPEVTVNLTNRTRPFLFADTEFDAALYFGDGVWSGTVANFLMHENPVPVCSPELLGGRRRAVRRADRRVAADAADHPALRLATVVRLAGDERGA
jgi:Transcriptional regulator